MLTLNLAEGGQSDIPFASVLFIEEKADDDKLVSVVYSLDGQTTEKMDVTDNYGYLKKKLTDNNAITRPIEVTTNFLDKKQRLYISENYILTRRDIMDEENPCNTSLVIRVNGPLIKVDVIETRAQLDGAD